MPLPKVLFVDDEQSLLNGIRRVIRTGFELHFAESGAAALELVRAHGPFAVVVSDMRMPVMNGAELLEKLAATAPETVRVMLTGNADQQTAIDAVNRGKIYRFVNKPCQAADLVEVLNGACRQYDLVMAEKVLMEQTLSGVVRLLIEILNSAYPAVFVRVQSLRDLARAYAGALGGRAWMIDLAAMLSHIGWLTLPHDLVTRSINGAPVSPVEGELMAEVHTTAARLLAGIPRLEELSAIIAPKPGTDSIDGRIFTLLRAASEAMRRDRCSLAAVLEPGRLQQVDAMLAERLRELARAPGRAAEAAAAPESVAIRIESAGQIRLGDRLIEDLSFESGELAIGKGIEINEFLLEKLGNLARVRKLRLPVSIERALLQRPLAAAS